MKQILIIVIISGLIVGCKNKIDENKIVYSDPYITLTDKDVNIDSINSQIRITSAINANSIKDYIEIDSNKYEKEVSIGKKIFKVKNLPFPIASVGGSKGGTIKRDLLCKQKGVTAYQDNMDMSLNYKIAEFTLTTISKKGIVIENTSKSNDFTNAQRNQLNNLNHGDKVYIENIIAILLDGKKENIGTLAFKIE